MGKFKNWILKEGDQFISTGFALHTTDADDWNRVNKSATDIRLFRSKWIGDDKSNIELRNIDKDTIKNIRFASISSPTMPEAGDGHWTHKTDDPMKSSIAVQRNIDLEAFGVSRNSKTRNNIDDGDKSFLPADVLDKEEHLNKLFGDKGSGKYPEIDPKFMDKPFGNRYETIVK